MVNYGAAGHGTGVRVSRRFHAVFNPRCRLKTAGYAAVRLRCSAKSRHCLASFNIADLRSGSSAFTACLSHTLARTRHCLGVARRFADFIAVPLTLLKSGLSTPFPPPSSSSEPEARYLGYPGELGADIGVVRPAFIIENRQEYLNNVYGS